MSLSASSSSLNDSIASINSKKKVIEIVQQIGIEPELINKLIQLTTTTEKRIASHSSWIIRVWGQLQPDIAPKYIGKIIKILEKDRPDAVTRNLTGFLIDSGVPARYQGKITSLGFQLISQMNRPVAVYANALLLLAPVIRQYPDLQNELRLITMNHPEIERVSLKIRIKRIMEQKNPQLQQL